MMQMAAIAPSTIDSLALMVAPFPLLESRYLVPQRSLPHWLCHTAFLQKRFEKWGESLIWSYSKKRLLCETCTEPRSRVNLPAQYLHNL